MRSQKAADIGKLLKIHCLLSLPLCRWWLSLFGGRGESENNNAGDADIIRALQKEVRELKEMQKQTIELLRKQQGLG